MKSALRWLAAVSVLASAVGGCTLLEDNGTHLAYAIERGAKDLRASPQQELVVKYEPLGRAHEPYAVEIVHSKREVSVNALGNIDGPGGSYLVVTGKQRGGTNYHERFVFVPQDLRIEKPGTPTDVVLRKAGPRVDLVELR